MVLDGIYIDEIHFKLLFVCPLLVRFMSHHMEHVCEASFTIDYTKLTLFTLTFIVPSSSSYTAIERFFLQRKKEKNALRD